MLMFKKLFMFKAVVLKLLICWLRFFAFKYAMCLTFS